MIPLLVFVASAGLLYFAVVETAFGLLMRLPRRLEAERERAHDALGAYLNDPITFFVPARLMRGTVLIVVVILLAQPIGTGLVPALVLLGCGLALYVGVGQVLPAILVRRSPERVLDFFLPSFTALANIVAPVTSLIIAWLGSVERTEETTAAPATLPAAADPADPTTPRGEETRLLRSVVDFGDTLVREVMTPRPDIVAIRAAATVDELRRLVQEQEYSRLPVYSENLDNIVGLVVVKDLIQKTDAVPGSAKVTEIMRPAAFVPETKRVADLLREFQRKRFQLAVVVDEYGGTAGLVTMEDLLEEIVGEIRDEHDIDEQESISVISDREAVVEAGTNIEDVNAKLGTELPTEDFETIGGYTVGLFGRLPKEGEEIDGADHTRLRVDRTRGRRILAVRIYYNGSIDRTQESEDADAAARL
jgi:CBS domain containing-hemolysin-like protein